MENAETAETKTKPYKLLLSCPSGLSPSQVLISTWLYMCDKADSFGVHMILLSHAFVCGFEGFCGF
jgi:hypothetical protein